MLASEALTQANGEFVEIVAKNGAHIHVLLPSDADTQKVTECLLVLHGSYSNSKNYISTLAHLWPSAQNGRIIVGIDGDKSEGKDDNGEENFNYTFNSTDFVISAFKEVKQKYNISRTIVIGHSQGGVVSYAIYMSDPELFNAIIPVSARCDEGFAPYKYKDDARVASQKNGAIAIVHGENDDLMEFIEGRIAHDWFQDAGFPRIRMFTDSGAGHMFGRLPVDKALEWVESQLSTDPEKLLKFAESSIDRKEFADALAALKRCYQLDTKGKFRERIKKLIQPLDKECMAASKELEKMMSDAKDDSWVSSFLDFRNKFKLADSAKKVLDTYAKLRRQHESPAEELYLKAVSYFQQSNPAEARKCYEEIVKKYYASRRYFCAREVLRRKE